MESENDPLVTVQQTTRLSSGLEPTQQIPSPPIPKKNNSLLAVILILLFLGIGVGFVYVRKQTQPEKIPVISTPIPNRPTKLPIPTPTLATQSGEITQMITPTPSGPQIFNKIPSFTFSYPSYLGQWKDQSTPELSHYYTDYKSSETGNGGGRYADFRIGVVGPYPMDERTLAGWVEKHHPSISGDSGSGPLETITKNVTLNGIPAIQQSYTIKDTDVPAKYAVYFLAKGNVYQLYFNNQITQVQSEATQSRQFDTLFKEVLQAIVLN